MEDDFDKVHKQNIEICDRIQKQQDELLHLIWQQNIELQQITMLLQLDTLKKLIKKYY